MQAARPDPSQKTRDFALFIDVRGCYPSSAVCGPILPTRAGSNTRGAVGLLLLEVFGHRRRLGQQDAKV